MGLALSTAFLYAHLVLAPQFSGMALSGIRTGGNPPSLTVTPVSCSSAATQFPRVPPEWFTEQEDSCGKSVPARSAL